MLTSTSTILRIAKLLLGRLNQDAIELMNQPSIMIIGQE